MGQLVDACRANISSLCMSTGENQVGKVVHGLTTQALQVTDIASLGFTVNNHPTLRAEPKENPFAYSNKGNTPVTTETRVIPCYYSNKGEVEEIL